MATFLLCAAALAAWFPIQLSMAAVFLFAGPHNWLEARYFAARMPVRWTNQRAFFLSALTGVVVLSATFSFIPVSRPVWHTAAALWVLGLMRAARKQSLALALPVALSWMAVAWAAPDSADLILVFAHPLVALWFVHRQIVRSRPNWLTGFRLTALAIVPIGALIFSMNSGVAAARYSASFSQGSLTPPMIALHAFLELLHYGAWVILLPCIGLASTPWNLRGIPLAQHRRGWPKLVTTGFVVGAAAVILLWICFAIDYNTTRNFYFTLAIVHVIAEVPFLAWLR